jgi:hypothetical protein
MFTNGQEQSEQKDSETNNDATQGSDSTISRCIICSINRAKTRIDVRPEGSRSGRSDGGFSIYREYETTQNAFELKKERDRLENMLGIVASLRHASLEVGMLQ